MEFIQNYSTYSLSEMAVIYIKNKVLSGEFKSGDKLVESDISSALSISRAPVREAMRELSVQGMVHFFPRKGNYILDMSLNETLEVFDIRITLEQQILKQLVSKKMLGDDDYRHLLFLAKNMQDQEEKELDLHEKIYQLNYLDLDFHSYLWKKSGSFRRGKILEDLFFQLLIVMNRNVMTLGSFKEKSEEHRRIIAALQANDLDMVIAEFQDHLGHYIHAIQSDLS